MIARLRLLVAMVRPPVALILAMFAAAGLAQTERGHDPVVVAQTLTAVLGFLLFCVTVNDLADEAIDRVNLAGDPRRLLVAGTARRQELVALGVTGAAVALGAAATLGWAAAAVTAAGLAFGAGYSLRPVRLADRGAMASLALPAGYVAVPYLLGILAGRGSVRTTDLWLLTGLYLGFIGRILLKDFRDVRGDALFGKRTFLVRHGRARTCLVSACCWVAGTAALTFTVADPTVPLVLAWAAGLAGALVLLRALAVETHPRRDEALISGLALLGRGTILLLLAHLAILDAGWPWFAGHGVIAVLAVILAGQTHAMVRRGPMSGLTVAAIHAPASEANARRGEATERRGSSASRLLRRRHRRRETRQTHPTPAEVESTAPRVAG